MPNGVRDLAVQPIGSELDCRLVFSALPSEVTGPVEERFAPDVREAAAELRDRGAQAQWGMKALHHLETLAVSEAAWQNGRAGPVEPVSTSFDTLVTRR